MILAIASGKGGTGKTTIATALASVAAEEPGREVRLLDCDVEAPNVALSLDITWDESRRAGIRVPEVQQDFCTLCGECVDACRFGALAMAGESILVIENLCHGCGRCISRCPTRAMRERLRETGTLRAGRTATFRVAEGRLDVGEAMATPLIHQLKAWQLEEVSPGGLVLLDAPPGTSCPLVETLNHADGVVLVTEPTPFGLHDLELALRVSRDVCHLPIHVVLNRDDGQDETIPAFCAREGVPLSLRIPFEESIARAASEGIPLLDAAPELRASFHTLLDELQAVGSPS